MNLDNRNEMKEIYRLGRLVMFGCSLYQGLIAASAILQLMTLSTFSSIDGESFPLIVFGRNTEIANVSNTYNIFFCTLIVIEAMFYIKGLSLVKTLFLTYRRGILFDATIVKCFKMIAEVIIVLWVFSVCVNLSLPYIVPPEVTISDFNVSRFDISLIFIAGCAWAMSLIMNEARKIKEHDDFVI